MTKDDRNNAIGLYQPIISMLLTELFWPDDRKTINHPEGKIPDQAQACQRNDQNQVFPKAFSKGWETAGEWRAIGDILKLSNTRECFKMVRDSGSEEDGQPLKPVKKMVEGEQSLKMVEEEGLLGKKKEDEGGVKLKAEMTLMNGCTVSKKTSSPS